MKIEVNYIKKNIISLCHENYVTFLCYFFGFLFIIIQEQILGKLPAYFMIHNVLYERLFYWSVIHKTFVL